MSAALVGKIFLLFTARTVARTKEADMLTLNHNIELRKRGNELGNAQKTYSWRWLADILIDGRDSQWDNVFISRRLIFYVTFLYILLIESTSFHM